MSVVSRIGLVLVVSFTITCAFATKKAKVAQATVTHAEKNTIANPPQNIIIPYGGEYCTEVGYHCIHVKPTDHWNTLWPNYRERDVMMRLNRSNVELKYRTWVVVPNNLAKMNAMSVAPFPLRIVPPQEKEIIVNLGLEAYGAYNPQGYLVFWGPATPGRAWCPDINIPCPTPVGVFRVFKKEGPDCESNSFPVDVGGSPMPYCMFFHGGAALHGAEIPSIPSTHGCVGINNDDARWLNQLFVTADSKNGTTVMVYK